MHRKVTAKEFNKVKPQQRHNHDGFETVPCGFGNAHATGIRKKQNRRNRNAKAIQDSTNKLIESIDFYQQSQISLNRSDGDISLTNDGFNSTNWLTGSIFHPKTGKDSQNVTSTSFLKTQSSSKIDRPNSKLNINNLMRVMDNATPNSQNTSSILQNHSQSMDNLNRGYSKQFKSNTFFKEGASYRQLQKMVLKNASSLEGDYLNKITVPYNISTQIVDDRDLLKAPSVLSKKNQKKEMNELMNTLLIQDNESPKAVAHDTCLTDLFEESHELNKELGTLKRMSTLKGRGRMSILVSNKYDDNSETSSGRRIDPTTKLKKIQILNIIAQFNKLKTKMSKSDESRIDIKNLYAQSAQKFLINSSDNPDFQKKSCIKEHEHHHPVLNKPAVGLGIKKKTKFDPCQGPKKVARVSYCHDLGIQIQHWSQQQKYQFKRSKHESHSVDHRRIDMKKLRNAHQKKLKMKENA